MCLCFLFSYAKSQDERTLERKKEERMDKNGYGVVAFSSKRD